MCFLFSIFAFFCMNFEIYEFLHELCKKGTKKCSKNVQFQTCSYYLFVFLVHKYPWFSWLRDGHGPQSFHFEFDYSGYLKVKKTVILVSFKKIVKFSRTFFFRAQAYCHNPLLVRYSRPFLLESLEQVQQSRFFLSSVVNLGQGSDRTVPTNWIVPKFIFVFYNGTFYVLI